MIELNKALRYAKTNGDLKFGFVYTGPLDEMRLGVYCDGSLATRRDGSSQIGRPIFVFNELAWNRGEE
eukprot:9858121-Prorocentrum_lima.AAC.1